MRIDVAILAALWYILPIINTIVFLVAKDRSPQRGEFTYQYIVMVVMLMVLNSVFLISSLVFGKSKRYGHVAKCWSYPGMCSVVFVAILMIPPTVVGIVPMFGPFIPFLIVCAYGCVSLFSTAVLLAVREPRSA
jgi:hypothetical protein